MNADSTEQLLKRNQNVPIDDGLSKAGVEGLEIVDIQEQHTYNSVGSKPRAIGSEVRRRLPEAGQKSKFLLLLLLMRWLIGDLSFQLTNSFPGGRTP